MLTTVSSSFWPFGQRITSCETSDALPKWPEARGDCCQHWLLGNDGLVSLPELPIAEESSVTVAIRVCCEELSITRASTHPRLWIRQIWNFGCTLFTVWPCTIQLAICNSHCKPGILR